MYTQQSSKKDYIGPQESLAPASALPLIGGATETTPLLLSSTTNALNPLGTDEIVVVERPPRPLALAKGEWNTKIHDIKNFTHFQNFCKYTVQHNTSTLSQALAVLCFPCCFPLYCCPGFNVEIDSNQIGLVNNNGRPMLLSPGERHWLPSPITHFERAINIDASLIEFMSITIVNLRNNQVVYCIDNGQVHRLEGPGRYAWDSPLCKVYKDATHPEGIFSLDEKLHEVGNYKRIIVKNGEVGVLYEKGKLEVINKPMIYETEEPSAIFAGHLPVTIVVHKIAGVSNLTADGLSLTATAVVFYNIENVALLVESVGTRTYQELVDERAIAALSEAIRSCNLRDVGTRRLAAGATRALPDPDPLQDTTAGVDFSAISRAVHDNLLEHLGEVLKEIGIKLHQVQLEAIKPEQDLHAALAQQATATSEARARITKAQAETKATRLETEAEANKISTLAKARADEVELQGKAAASALEAKGKAEASALEAYGASLNMALEKNPQNAAAILITEKIAKQFKRANYSIVTPNTFLAYQAKHWLRYYHNRPKNKNRLNHHPEISNKGPEHQYINLVGHLCDKISLIAIEYES
ncbi:MAG: domain / Band 7 domain containing protein [Gammaproteobacteria bacterium]|nr:domain / Band 7 domain containing protein [Gammaproteobacteria bacterium]